jgi:hypothetical protein
MSLVLGFPLAANVFFHPAMSFIVAHLHRRMLGEKG